MSRENNLRVPTPKQVLSILDQHPQGVSCTALSRILKMDRRSIRMMLKKLEQKDEILKNGSFYFSRSNQTDRTTGIFRRKITGSGLVFCSDRNQDVLINRKQGYNLFDGDFIEVSVFSERMGQLKGSVLAVVRRRENPVPGYYRPDNRTIVVHPLDPRTGPPVRITEKPDPRLKGKVVLAELDPVTDRRAMPTGKVIKVLGRRFDFGVQTEILTRKFGIRDEMPESVIRDAATLIEKSAFRDTSSRRDLRTIPTVTVDPQHARDFDDALSLIDIPDGQRLMVHIADVSHYVPAGSLVDQEAFRRGTSVYLPERAIHMLPESLATNVCSLLPNTDRFAVSVAIDYDSDGRARSGEVFESLIRSDARLTYSDFLNASERKKTGVIDDRPDLLEMCRCLTGLCSVLVRQRIERGVLDLDMPESFFELGDDGSVIGIHRKSRSIAEQTIEEFMIAANVFVARFLEARQEPYLRRVHDTPDPSEINELKEGLRQLGLIPPANPLDPNEVRRLLASIDNGSIRSVASHRILRAMRRAVYSATRNGHFGLALEYYTQFTSPIRRYPDLEVHRSVKSALKLPGYPHPDPAELTARAELMSEYERRAQETEWEAVRIEKIRFMQSRIGQSFSGTITHVIEFGAYVELDEPFVEGFLPVSLMKDYLHFNARTNTLSNSRGTIRLKPGQTVRAILEIADLDRGTLDFKLA